MRYLHGQIDVFSCVIMSFARLLTFVMKFEVIQHDLSNDQRSIGDDQEDDQSSKEHRLEYTTDDMLMSKALIPPFRAACRWFGWSRLFQAWLTDLRTLDSTAGFSIFHLDRIRAG